MITKPFTLGLVGKVVLNVVGIVGLATLEGCDSQGNPYPSTQMNIGSAVAQNAALNTNLQPEQVQSLGIAGALLGVLASQQAQREAAEIGRTNVNVNVNNANQPTASDSSIQYVKDQKMPEGNTYTGQLKLMSDGLFRPHGRGVMIWPDGQRYEGEWKDGKGNGQGVLILPSGERYEGAFKDGERNGRGVEAWPDGKRYEGEWKDSKVNGQGVYTHPNGERYEGVWKDGRKNGQGVHTWPDGKRYEGEWKDDTRNGQGVHTWPDGKRYEGAWKDDKQDGQGVHTWPDGTRYEGEWKDDKQNGKGKFVYADGKRYEGEFVNGTRNGQGVHTWPDGTLYEGEWKDGKMQGFGKMVYADGRTEEGEWRDNKFIGSQSQVSTGDNQKSQGDSSKFGFVNVTADDPTFEVFADGAFVGNSPAKLKLSEGPHTIEVRKEGFKDYKKEIRVTDGSELNLKVVLEKQ